MKIFVSGKFADKVKINNIIEDLEKLGYIITFNWTQYDEIDDTGEKKRIAGILDADGVKDADMHICILDDPHHTYRGTFTEIGISIGLDKPIVIYSPHDNADYRETPFLYHPNITCYTDWYDFWNYLTIVAKI